MQVVGQLGRGPSDHRLADSATLMVRAHRVLETPLGWEHLSLTGDYVWDTDDQPAPGELRPLRTKPSLLAA